MRDDVERRFDPACGLTPRAKRELNSGLESADSNSAGMLFRGLEADDQRLLAAIYGRAPPWPQPGGPGPHNRRFE